MHERPWIDLSKGFSAYAPGLAMDRIELIIKKIEFILSVIPPIWPVERHFMLFEYLVLYENTF